MNNQILTIQEIQDAGFIHTPFIAFVRNKHTDVVGTDVTEECVPSLTFTYLLGEEKEWDIKLYDIDGVKQRAIAQMNKLGIRWVYSVYYGEIYIPKDNTSSDRYHHIFARAKVKNK
jgi:hypothetical protein